MQRAWEDAGPMLDCVLFHTGAEWRALVLRTDDEAAAAAGGASDRGDVQVLTVHVQIKLSPKTTQQLQSLVTDKFCFRIFKSGRVSSIFSGLFLDRECMTKVFSSHPLLVFAPDFCCLV